MEFLKQSNNPLLRSITLFSMNVANIQHYYVEYSQSHKTLLWIWIMLHLKLRNTNLHNITHSLISWNPRERMSIVQIPLLIVTFLSLISRILSLMPTTKEVIPRPRIAPCVNMWSAIFFFFFFLCHLLMLVRAYSTLPGKAKWSGAHQRRWEENEFQIP